VVTDMHLKLGLGPELGALALRPIARALGLCSGTGKNSSGPSCVPPGTDNLLLAILSAALRIGRLLALRIAFVVAALLIAAAAVPTADASNCASRSRALQPSASRSYTAPYSDR
jgi:hypothetical protein